VLARLSVNAKTLVKENLHLVILDKPTVEPPAPLTVNPKPAITTKHI
jgi:hypothetical protein